MSIKTAYVSQLGKDYKISDHFTLGEAQCHDGTDKVLYSTDLVPMLEKLRSYGGFTINIISWYRTQYYNDHMKPPGAKNSQHIQGTAADVCVKKNGVAVSGKLIACLAQTLGFKGIGYMSETAVHLDMRESGTYRGNENANGKRTYGNNVGDDFYSYFGVNMSQITALKTATATTTTCEKTEEDEEMYNKMDEVPESYRAAVQRRLDAGFVTSWPLEESMVRGWVVEDREDPIYNDLKDVPDCWIDDATAMVNAGIIKGDGQHQLAKRKSVLEAAIIAWRIHTIK